MISDLGVIMPRKTQRKKQKTTIAIIGSVIIILLAGLFLVSRKASTSKTDPSPSGSGTVTVQTTSEPGSDSAQENPKNATPTPVPTAQSGSGKQSLVPVVSSYGYDSSRSEAYINSTLGQSGGGTCTLTLSKAGQGSITRTASASLVVNYYGCGFSVARSAFSVSGDWTARVKFSNDRYEGESESKTISVE